MSENGDHVSVGVRHAESDDVVDLILSLTGVKVEYFSCKYLLELG